MTDPIYKVGIIGYGVVGKGIHLLLDEMVVAIYDPEQFRIEMGLPIEKGIKYRKENFKDLDLVVICVPTPTSKDGQTCDVSIVEETLEWLMEIGSRAVRLIKSTVPPSFVLNCQVPRLVFSPEFLGESKYFTPPWKYPDPMDMRTHTWQTFGGEQEDTDLCVEIFKRKMSVDTQFFQTDIVTASLAKYIENSFFAMKVTFVNEWYDLAKAWGVSWNELRELWLADPRINRNHTLVFPKDRGYGGKCFPKDVKAIIADAKSIGVELELMQSVDKVNERIRHGK